MSWRGVMTEYRVQFTVEARAAYDDLPGERRAQLVVLGYMVAGAIMVFVVVEIFDESAYLVDEADTQ